MPRKAKHQSLKPPDGYQGPPGPTRKLNPLRMRLKRFLEQRWASANVPIKTSEIMAALGLTHGQWGKSHHEIKRWMSVMGWRESSRKLGKDQPVRTGFWPPMKPPPKIDEWSEYDESVDANGSHAPESRAMPNTPTLAAIDHCPGWGDGPEDWLDECHDCQRRTSATGPSHIEPPQIVALWCEAYIPPDWPEDQRLRELARRQGLTA